MAEDLYNVVVVSRTGARIVELEKAKLSSCSWVLNDAGKATFTVPTDDDKIGAPNYYPRLKRDEVQIWRQGTLIWWGFPDQAKSGVAETEFICQEIPAYFLYRFVLAASLDYVSLDQLTIGANIVQAMQAGDRNLNIGVASFTPSGKVRSRMYDRYNHDNALDLLQEFNGLDDGFDWSIEYNLGNKEWTPWYPKKGVNRDPITLEWTRNIIDFTVSEDATELGNHVYVTGGSEGDVKFENNYKHTASVAERGVFEKVISESNQKDVTELLERATEHANQYKDPIVIPELTAVDVPVTLMGVLKTGDVVPIFISHGRASIDASYLIQEMQWNAEPDNLTLKVQRP